MLATIEAHGDDPTQSLAAINVDATTLEALASIGDSELGETVEMLGSATTVETNGKHAEDSDFRSTTDGSSRFRILRLHKRGGLGSVSLALDTELNREVALKQILGRHADDPASRSRFLLEAEITGGLEHPGIVPVYGARAASATAAPTTPCGSSGATA